MFWIGAIAGYFVGFGLAWILSSAIRGWDRQDRICMMEGHGGHGAVHNATARAAE